MNFHLTAEQADFQTGVQRFISSDLPAGWDEDHDSLTERMDVERADDEAARGTALARTCHGRRRTAAAALRPLSR